MAKIRVLVVDDSVVIRRLVTDVLTSDPEIEVVGVAANGRIALEKITQVNPDLVTLDVEMPEMDGLQTLAAIRKTHPRLPVIMFSTLTERGGVTTLEALSLGASDYVTKPANVGSASAAMARVRDDLIPKIKGLCGRASNPQVKLPVAISAVRRPTPSHAAVLNRRIEIVAIGTSTGGPNALGEIVPEIPGDFPVPIVIVQHMPPIFTKLLADRLAAKSNIDVQECRAGDELRPAAAWIAPGDYHMIVDKSAGRARLDLNQGPPENSCRPAVDVLFRSVARIYGPSVLTVILTGMGKDGFRGCEHIREVGGQIIVQDEASSVVWGMPGFVARAGLADQVLPIEQIAGEIVRRVMHGRIFGLGTKQEESKHGNVGR
jgi:two-component system, chemotaxis family, protein-glutamate methylesterase/glutaminase